MDFSKYTLVLYTYREIDEETGEPYPDYEAEEFPWLDQRRFIIKNGAGAEVGWVSVDVIDVDWIVMGGDDFRVEMDLPDEQYAVLSKEVFNRDGMILSKSKEQGNRSFGDEVNHPCFTYIKVINIEESMRGKGVGSWALNAVHKIAKESFDSKDIFAWPSPPRPSAIKDRAERTRLFDQVTKFYHQNGYRRVGNTCFFCFALDPRHPSHSIKPEDDGKEGSE